MCSICDYRSKVDTDVVHTQVLSNEFHLVDKLNHEIFNMPQQMAPNVKIGI